MEETIHFTLHKNRLMACFSISQKAAEDIQWIEDLLNHSNYLEDQYLSFHSLAELVERWAMKLVEWKIYSIPQYSYIEKWVYYTMTEYGVRIVRVLSKLNFKKE